MTPKATKSRKQALPATKVCTKCGKRKKLEAFHVDKAHSVGGRRSHCKACVAVYDARTKRAYYVANRDRRLLAVKAYYAANRSKKAAYNRAYREANLARITAQQAEYVRLHREAIRSKGRAYHAENREWRNWQCQQNSILRGGI